MMNKRLLVFVLLVLALVWAMPASAQVFPVGQSTVPVEGLRVGLGGIEVGTFANDFNRFQVAGTSGVVTGNVAYTGQTTETNGWVLDFDTDSTYITGTNIGFSTGQGSSALDISGTASGVNGAYIAAQAFISNTGEHTVDGAGVMGMKAVVTNSASMTDGNIFGAQFIAKHSHATNRMLNAASLIGLEAFAYPSNVGYAGTLIGGNFGYHIAATTENHAAGSVARGVQIFCDDASSNTDPVEETALTIWNMAGDQDNVINVVESASGFTNFLLAAGTSAFASVDAGTPGANSTHKLKVKIGGTTGYLAVYADY